MFLTGLRLVNFRSYCDTEVAFGPGLNVVVGDNATGKTNLLEAAYFALRGRSPRTRRDEKLVTWGERYARVTVTIAGAGDDTQRVEVAYAPGQGKRARWDGLEVQNLDELRRRWQVFIFVPESLLLVKGSPARRRAQLDAFAAAIDRPYAAAARELQAALRQRNAQLANVRAGASPATLDPWDVQFARAAVELGRRRETLVRELGDRFAEAAAALAPAGERFALQLVTQLAAIDYDETALRDRMRERRGVELGRALTLIGPHRDDLRFVEVASVAGETPLEPVVGDGEATGGVPSADGAAGRQRAGGGELRDDDEPHDGPADDREPGDDRVPGDVPEGDDETDGSPADVTDDAPEGDDERLTDQSAASCGLPGLPPGGRDLRLFGSQGEQRAAVLALLLAEQGVAAERGGDVGVLFLDDVMSELDDRRRRLLVAMLAGAGQAIITTTDRHYFTDAELDAATVVELPLEGSLARSGPVRS